MSKPPARQRFRFNGRKRPWALILLCSLGLLSTACRADPSRPGIATAPADPPAHEDCDAGLQDAAAQNRQTLDTLPFAPFRRPEVGWEIYAPLVAREASTACAAGSPGFAQALQRWQRGHGLGSSGVLDVATFSAMEQRWQQRRPFVLANRYGCPAEADPAALVTVPARDSYGGKVLTLLTPAMDAYRQMLAAAHAESPAVASDPRLLTIFSAFRSAESDAARCARENNCQGIVRATCSAHRTGLAMDVYLGSAPGFGPDSSADPNRLFISRGPAYRWMVRNAARFGFAPYPFEPWHWEWTG